MGGSPRSQMRDEIARESVPAFRVFCGFETPSYSRPHVTSHAPFSIKKLWKVTLTPTKPTRGALKARAARCTRVARALQMAPKSKAKAKGSPEAEPVEVEPPEVEVTDEALEAARQLKLQEKMAMRAAREAEVAEQTAKMNFEVKVNETVEEGRKIEQEIQEAKDLGLSPFKAVRMRRKSKELEANANDLLSAALDKIFLECNCESKMWPLPRVAFRAGSTSP